MYRTIMLVGDDNAKKRERKKEGGGRKRDIGSSFGRP